MFDFEKLDVYHKAKGFNHKVRAFIQKSGLDRSAIDQLSRASFSIALNIAEGTGRFTNKDKRHFYVIARSSTFECVAIFDILKEEGYCTGQEFERFYSMAEELSKMLFAMIRHLEQ